MVKAKAVLEELIFPADPLKILALLVFRKALILCFFIRASRSEGKAGVLLYHDLPKAAVLQSIVARNKILILLMGIVENQIVKGVAIIQGGHAETPPRR